MKEIEEDAAFYDESRGGVTFSGGEPLLQSAFLDAVLADCREQRIHTVVETCGFAPYKTISRICDKVDLFLYDIKIMDTGKHRKYTGVPNERILTNLKKLAQDRSDVVISFPIVPRINDNEENIVATAEFVRSLPDVKSVNLLPYHRGGVEKYRSLGRTYGLDGIQPPSTYRMKRIKEKLETFGIRAEVGGE
jgi:pyruvate formate lyase activating enzyme